MEIKGIDKLRKKLSNISQLVPREAAVVLTDAVLEMQGFSQGKMQADAGGVLSTRSQARLSAGLPLASFRRSTQGC
jgi:hypothetical protein